MALTAIRFCVKYQIARMNCQEYKINPLSGKKIGPVLFITALTWQPHISKLLVILCLDISYEELNTFPPNRSYQIPRTMPLIKPREKLLVFSGSTKTEITLYVYLSNIFIDNYLSAY